MLAGGADTLTTLEKDINRDLKPHSRELPGWTASVAVKMHRGKIDVKNIVGVLEGAGPLANETVVVGAPLRSPRLRRQRQPGPLEENGHPSRRRRQRFRHDDDD